MIQRRYAALMPLAMALAATADAKPATETSGSKILVENDILRATKVTIHPGDRIEVPAYNRLFYHVVSGGRIKAIFASGETAMWEPPTDEANWAEHEPPHGSENVGKTTVVYVAVELKK